MASEFSRVLTQALLAKGPKLRDTGRFYKDLSSITPVEAIAHASDYLAAVANIVDIDTQELISHLQDRDDIAREKRGVLMGYLKEARTRPESSGEFLQDASRLLVNVQRAWVVLAQERPLNRFFDLARTYPELILPEAFGIRYYFDKGDVASETITVMRYAAGIPDLASGVVRGPAVHEHKRIQ